MTETEVLVRELATITPEALKAAEDLEKFDCVQSSAYFLRTCNFFVSDNVHAEEPLVVHARQLTFINTESTEYISMSVPIRSSDFYHLHTLDEMSQHGFKSYKIITPKS